MFCLLVFSVFLTGVRSQSDSLDFGDPSSVLSNTDKDLAIKKFRDIKNPDDIPQIKDWKNKCEEKHGAETVKEIEEAPNELVKCVLEYVKPHKLQVEVNKSMATGNLDRLFKKYCGYRNNILSCVDTMLDKLRTCMTPQQLTDVNVTRQAVDAAIDFTCHDDGDRIALFMAEKGVECLKEHRESIQACMKERVPQLQQTMDDPDSLDLDSVVINEEQCGKINSMHQCVVQETTKCSDPTPANILDALITQMLKVTPCWNINTKKAQQQSSSSSSGSEEGVSSGASSLSSLIRNSIAGIGPLLASGCFSGAACAVAALTSFGVLLSSALLHAQTLCVMSIGAVLAFVFSISSFCYGATCSLISTTGALLSSGHSALCGVVSSKHDNLKSLAASLVPSVDWYAVQSCVGAWSLMVSVTQQCWLLMCSSVSVSVLLVIALSAVTAANVVI